MALSQSVSMNDLLVLLLHCYPGPVRRVSRWSAQSVVRVLASRGVGRTSASSAARVLTPFAVLSSCRARTRATASRCIALPSPSYEADLINEISFTWGKAVKELVYWSDDISRTTASLNLYPGGIESQRKLLLCEVHGGFRLACCIWERGFQVLSASRGVSVTKIARISTTAASWEFVFLSKCSPERRASNDGTSGGVGTNVVFV